MPPSVLKFGESDIQDDGLIFFLSKDGASLFVELKALEGT